MGSQRREFTPEYKDEAVKLAINTGRPIAVVARELGVVEQTLAIGSRHTGSVRRLAMAPD